MSCMDIRYYFKMFLDPIDVAQYDPINEMFSCMVMSAQVN